MTIRIVRTDSLTSAERRRDMVSAYTMSRMLRRQLNELLRPLVGVANIREILDSARRWNFENNLMAISDKIGGRPVSATLCGVVPNIVGRLSNLKDDMTHVDPDKRKSRTYSYYATRSCNAFLDEVKNIRPSTAVQTHRSRKTEIVKVKGSGHNVVVTANISPGWVHATEKLGFRSVQDRYVVLNVEESYDLDELAVYRCRVLDLSKLEEKEGYIAASELGDGHVRFFSEEMRRAIKVARSRVSMKVLERLGE